MANLSVSASAILNYAEEHVTEDGYADLQDYTDFPQKTVINACEELLERGHISDYAKSEDGVEFVKLK